MVRKSFILVSCLFVLALAIIGCGGGGGGSASNPAGPAVTTGETASLSGTVLFNNAPIPFASVHLYKSDKAHTVGMAQLPALKGSLVAQQIIGDGAYSTTTSAEGVYNFTGIPVGQYTLIAMRDENHQFVQTGVLLGQVTTLNPQLTPTGKITGNVTLSIGGTPQAIAGAFVYINGTSYIAVSDTAGNFAINNVPSNTLTTSTAYEILVSSTKGNASPVTGVVVSPGATTDIGIIAMTAPTQAGYATLNGSLVAGQGVSDLSGMFVILTHQTSGSIFGTHTDATGKFQFRVMETGDFLVLCPEPDYTFTPDPLTVNVSSLANQAITLSQITVDAEPTAETGSIIGTVTMAGAPLTGAVVHVSGTSLLGVSNSTGNFIIEKVAVNSSTTPYSVEVSASMGSAPAKTGVVVSVGQSTDIGAFAISLPTTGYKTIVGTLTALLPVSPTQMTGRLVQLTAPDGKVSAAFSNASGGFSFFATQIGNHSITVMDTEFAYIPRTQTINVAALDNATLSLPQINVTTLNNTGTISGQVTHEGSPVAGAVVNIVGTSRMGVSDSGGNYVIERVPANISHTVQVSSKVGTAAPASGVTVTVGAVFTVNFDLIVPPAYKTVTGMLSPVSPVTTAQLGNRLVQLAMPDGKVIAAYSDSAGAFSFMVSQAGLSTVTVIDKDFVYDPRTQSVNVTALDNGSVSQAISVINASQVVTDTKVSVDGMINKLIKIRPEVDNGGVSVKLAPEAATPALYALTNPDGSFRFMVEPGTYTLTVEGRYQLALSPITVEITGPYMFPPPAIAVRPVNPVTSIVEGTVTWAAPPGGWMMTDGEVILQNQAGTPAFSELRPASALTGFFRFDSVPPGSYTATISRINGYSGQASVSIIEGQDLTVANTTAINISATFYAPFINSITVSGNVLAISGLNFELNDTMMQAIVNGVALPSAGGWVAGESYFNISSLAPGSYSVQLIKNSDTYGNKSTFTREVQAPLLANFTASSTDTSITFTWQNAPYVNEAEIRLLQGGAQIRAPQRIVGNSFTYDNLLPGISYTIEVISTYPNVPNSAPTPFNFTTKADSINNIPSFPFTGAGIATGTIFGFEVVGNNAYVAFDDDGALTIQSFDLTTNALTSSSAQIFTTSSPSIQSMAANSTGVYLTYFSSMNYIAAYSPALGSPAATKSLNDYGITVSDMATVRCLNDRIFLAARQSGNVEVRELSTALSEVATYSATTAQTGTSGKTVDLARDNVTDTLYLINTDMMDTPVRAFSGMDIEIAGPPVIGKLPSVPYIINFSAANNQVFITAQPSTDPVGYIMDPRSSFIRNLGYPLYPANFGHDKQHRIWMRNAASSGNHLLQLDDNLSVQKSLNIYNTAYITNNCSLARLEPSTGIMYMLHFNASNQLAVYRYNSNY